jgi:hemerythrin superfamily protein
MQREAEPEPTNLIVLLRHAHREIKLLLTEMDDILETPTAVFELYPRIQSALRAHDAGENYALYGPMREMPESSQLLDAAESAHQEIEEILRNLDRVPFRKEQIQSQEWKRTFGTLRTQVLDHMRIEEEMIFPRLETFFVKARLEALGERYKRGLKGELGPLPPMEVVR